jgi:hypothetical protein
MTYWAHSNPNDTDTDDGQRPCALEGRCAERDHQGQPKPGPRAFCGSDHAIIGRSLAWLPEAWVRLHGMLGEKGTGRGEKVSSTPTPSAPYNFEVDALLTDMVGLLDEWAVRVRDVAQLYQVPTEHAKAQRDAVIVEAAVKTLAAHLDALLALPPAPMERFLTLDQAADLNAWPAPLGDGDRRHEPELDGADAGIEILHLHRRARYLLGLNPKHVDLPVPCWECGLKTVRRWDGSAGLEDQAECSNPNCRAVYTSDRYVRLLADAAQQQQAKGTRRKASA